jgi:hypothetical protein
MKAEKNINFFCFFPVFFGFFFSYKNGVRFSSANCRKMGTLFPSKIGKRKSFAYFGVAVRERSRQPNIMLSCEQSAKFGISHRTFFIAC